MSMKIENYKSFSSGALVGRFDLTVEKWGIQIAGVSHFKKGDNEWIKLPQEPYTKDGETKYKNIIRFQDAAISEAFNKEVIKRINAAAPAPTPTATPAASFDLF